MSGERKVQGLGGDPSNIRSGRETPAGKEKRVFGSTPEYQRTRKGRQEEAGHGAARPRSPLGKRGVIKKGNENWGSLPKAPKRKKEILRGEKKRKGGVSQPPQKNERQNNKKKTKREGKIGLIQYGRGWKVNSDGEGGKVSRSMPVA